LHCGESVQFDSPKPLKHALEIIEYDVVRKAFEDKSQLPVWVDPVIAVSAEEGN
jgi:hypothetical protein